MATATTFYCTYKVNCSSAQNPYLEKKVKSDLIAPAFAVNFIAAWCKKAVKL
jgi:hypothetical protein